MPRLMKPQRIEGIAFLRRVVFRPSDGGAGCDPRARRSADAGAVARASACPN